MDSHVQTNSIACSIRQLVGVSYRGMEAIKNISSRSTKHGVLELHGQFDPFTGHFSVGFAEAMEVQLRNQMGKKHVGEGPGIVSA